MTWFNSDLGSCFLLSAQTSHKTPELNTDWPPLRQNPEATNQPTYSFAFLLTPQLHFMSTDP